MSMNPFTVHCPSSAETYSVSPRTNAVSAAPNASFSSLCRFLFNFIVPSMFVPIFVSFPPASEIGAGHLGQVAAASPGAQHAGMPRQELRQTHADPHAGHA